MSVDYCSCDCCNEARYEEFIHSCEKCGRNICCDCIDSDEEYAYYPQDVLNKDGDIKKECCPFCSGKVINDKELLNYVIKKYNLNIIKIREDFLKEKF